jgi:hypothetical protein
VKKMDKVDGPEVDKSEWIKLKIFMDQDNPVSGSKRLLTVYYLQGWIPRGSDQVSDDLP